MKITQEEEQVWLTLFEEKRRFLEAESGNISVKVSDFEQFQTASSSLSKRYAQRALPRLLLRLYPTLSHITSFTKAISSCAQSNTIATLIWGGLQATLEIACRYCENLEKFVDNVAEINSSLPLMDSYLTLFGDHPQLRWPLQDMYRSYLDYCTNSMRIFRRKSVLSVLKFALPSSQTKTAQQAKNAITNHRHTFFEQAKLIHRHATQAQTLRQLAETRDLAVQLDQPSSRARKFSFMPTQSATSTIYNIPNQNFVGREAVLDSIHDHLNSLGSQTGSIPSCVVVHGIAGVGKTTVARRYAHLWANEYEGAFWLRAESKVDLAEAFAEIADKLKITPRTGSLAVDTVRKWLENTDERWLIVFDNVESLNDITAYWPSKTTCNGSIIVTTQRPGFPSLKNVHEISLQSLTQEEGCTLLSEGLIERNPKRDLLIQIVNDVGALPLALVVVGGYIRQSGSTLSEFAASFRYSAGLWNASAEKTGSPYNKSLVNICRLAIAELSQDAEELLYLLAFLNPDEVPERLLHSAARQRPWWKTDERYLSFAGISCLLATIVMLMTMVMLQIKSRHILGFTIFVLTIPSCFLLVSRIYSRPKEEISFLERVLEPGAFMDITAELRQRQLISRGTTTNGSRFLTMHRSLQWSILHILNDDQKKTKRLFQQIFDLLRANLPISDNVLRTVDPAQRSLFEMVAPQVISLDNHVSNLKPALNNSTDFAFLLCDLGTFMWLEGLDREYIGIMQSAELIFDKVHHDEYAPIRSKLNIHLGRAAEMRGVDGFEIGLSRKRKAVQICERNLKRRLLARRDDILVVWSARTDLVVALINNEMYEEADKLMRLAREQYGRWGTESDEAFEYAQWYNHNAWVRMWQGKPQESLLMQKKGIELQIVACGRDHGLVFFKRFFLGCLLWIAGETDEAIRQLKSVLDDRVRVLGEGAFHSLQSLAYYGAILQCVGRDAEAERHLRDCLSQASKYNWYPAHIARAQFYLARSLRNLGRVPEALELERQCSQFRDEMLKAYPHILQEDPNDEASVFDQMVPSMTGKVTSKLLCRKQELIRKGQWNVDDCTDLAALGPC